MIIIPSRSEAAGLADGYRRVPVAGVMPSDGIEPSDCFLKLKRLSKQCFVLESMEDESDTGRYTFLGYDPKMELTGKDGSLVIRGGADIEIQTDDPGAQIRKVIADNISPRVPELPPFTGGLVGYFSYDYITYSEPTIDLGEDDVAAFRDVDLMLFDKLIAFDRFEKNIYLIVNIRTDAVDENYNRALGEIEHMSRIITGGEMVEPEKLRLTSEWKPMFGKDLYCDMVRRAKRYIHEGDIFQVVLSNRLECDAEGSLFESYRAMREANPSPYMFYFSSDDIEIAGAAPETLVK
ncbi:MAG: chorismate-binding protein, partial [Clostridiales Family XIII bacterium]|nr:chorismate-binding protein [Clostridiales Family XIII bacterium]